MNFTLHKKGFIFSFIISLLLLVSSHTSGQMRQVYVDIANNHISRISFFSPSKGYAGFKDWVGYTTDSGRTFTKKYINFGNVNYNGYSPNLTFGFNINGVSAISQDTLVVYGDYGFEPSILYSSNGGNSYILVYHTGWNPPFSGGVGDIVFPQRDNVGFAIAENRILKTVDKGRNWFSVYNNAANYFGFLRPLDNNNLFVFNSAKLYKTSNGGMTWQQVTTVPAGEIRYVDFISTSKGWANITNAGQNYFYYTSNGGTSWTQRPNVSNPFLSVAKMQFTNDSTGFAIGYNYKTFKTTDSGKIWEPLPRDNNYDGGWFGHLDLQCLNNNQLWAGGSNGFLELSTNGGGTPLPKAYFSIDTNNVYNTSIVKLVNASKTTYQYQWFKNDVLISTSYHTTYTANFFHPLDTIKLVVSNGTNTDTLIRYQYADVLPPIPVITSFTPTAGVAGTSVSITGSNFNGTTAVSFGGTPASSFTVNSATSITAIVAGGSSGSVAVTNQYGTGTLAGFNYISFPAPVITSFSPTFGQAGTTVTITGSYFDPVAANNIVYFGAARAVVSAASATQLVVQVPTGATFKPITVLNTSSHFMGYSVKPFVVTFPGGGGAFTSSSFERIPINTPSGGWPNIENGDFDNDGKPDIVIGNNSSNGGQQISVYRNTSTPAVVSFVPAGTYLNLGEDRTIRYIRTGDIDGDGKLDIVVSRDSNYNGIGIITVFRNTSTVGNISFAAYLNFPSGNSQNDLAIRDMDGDGRSDVISSTGDPSRFVILRNISTVGNIAFAPKTSFGTGGAFGLTIDDVDNDDKPDVIITRWYPDSITVYKNSSTVGTMQLAPVVSYYVAGNSPERIYTADLDGDTKTDISVTHSGGQTLSTFRNIGTAGSIAFANRVDFTFSTNVGAEQAVGDLNGDGKVDIAGATGNGPAILNNLGTPGTISLAAPVWLNSFYDGYYSLADYDGDGKLDIGVLELAFTQITIFRNKFIGSLANAGPDANLCLGDSIQLGVSAVAGNTYSWTSSPAGFTSSIANPFVRPLVTTTYYLTVVNGPTTAKDTVVITVNPVPAANAGADRTICASANTTIGTAASGGNTYSWSSSPAGFTSATANPTVNPVVNTSYYLTVTNGFGCTAKDTVLVTVSTPVANAGPDKQLCPGDATGIGVAATGDTYAWTSNPAGFVSTISNPTVSPAVTTTYFLAVTNALTCVARDTVTVTVGLPVANAGADKTICNGSSTAIGSSGTANNVYSWTSAPAGFTSSSPNPTVNPLVTTSYFLQVTNGSCIARDTVIVNVTPISAPAVSITASNTTVCAGVVVTFTATPVNGGSTPAYQWQVNGVNAGTNSNVFSSGSLTNGSVVKVILTSNASCLSATTATSNSISITVNAVTPAVSVSASATNICPGQNVTFTANPVNGGSNPVYQWKKNGINVGTNSATYNSNTLQNGDQVNVVLSSNAPCAIPATVSGNPVTILVNTNVVAGITASGNTTVVQGASTLISTAITNGGNSPAYQWQDSTAVHSWQNINGATASSVNYTPAASGNKLKCILTGSNPCVVNNTVPSNVLTFIVAPFFTTPTFYPNPVIDHLVVDGLSSRESWESVHIVTMAGAKIFEVPNLTGLTKVVVNLKDLPPGIYICMLYSRFGYASYFKFVKL